MPERTIAVGDNRAFIKEARLVHGRKFDYSEVDYVNSQKKVKIWCKACEKFFMQRPTDHLRERGCKHCRYERSAKNGKFYTDQEFRQVLRGLYGTKISVSKLKYEGQRTPITVWCMSCKAHFTKQTRYLLDGIGCPGCEKLPVSRSSNVAIRWMEYEAKKRRMKIQHAGNCGEFKVPGTRWRADGYNARTNTIFEFYGDRFHGNPTTCEPEIRPNPFSEKTAKELYKATMKREKELKALGYNVVSIWESDWKQLRRTVHSFA